MPENQPFRFGSTLAERKAARLAQEQELAGTKAVQDDDGQTENKAVAKKATSKKRTSGSGD